ncbi:hypothetical protein BDZ97DRAFT_1915993 [Flammula alnicola]|nr:hypothetical protein BDZ97DRAFT_1915993 [Flammula alnicola]
MKGFTYLAVAFLSAGSALAAHPLVINTPVSVVSGKPTLITWSGGVPPYFLVRLMSTIVPGNDPTAPPIVDLGQQTGKSAIWNTDVAAGTLIDFEIKDSTGAVAQSAPVVVQVLRSPEYSPDRSGWIANFESQ